MEKMVNEIKRDITLSTIIIMVVMGFLFFCTLNAIIMNNEKQQEQYEKIIKAIEKKK